MKRKVLFITLLILTSVSLLIACAAPAPAPAPAPTPPEPAQEIKPIVWRLASNFSSVGTKGDNYRRFAEIIEGTSDGRLVIETYYDASLGFKNSEALVALKNGLCEITELIAGSNMGSEPFDALGFLFLMHETRFRQQYWQTNVFYPTYNEILERKGWNARILADLHHPAVFFFSKKPLRKLEDWQGLSVRTWGGATSEALELIGCSPLVISTAEIFDALHRGMIEAAITTYVSATETHFWEVLDYVNYLSMGDGQDGVAVRLDAFQELPADLQGIVSAAFDDLDAHFCQEWVYQDNLLQILLDGGMEVVYPETGVGEEMRSILVEAGYYKRFADKAGPEAVKMYQEYGLY